MDFDNIFGSLSKNTDKIGALAGLFLYSGAGSINEIIDDIQRIASGTFQMPDIGKDIRLAFEHGSLQSAALLFLAGYVAKEFNLPIIGKYGTAMQNLGLGFAAGSVAHNVIEDIAGKIS